MQVVSSVASQQRGPGFESTTMSLPCLYTFPSHGIRLIGDSKLAVGVSVCVASMQHIGSLFRVCPAACPMTAGIGFSPSTTPKRISRLRWMEVKQSQGSTSGLSKVCSNTLPILSPDDPSHYVTQKGLSIYSKARSRFISDFQTVLEEQILYEDKQITFSDIL